MPDRLLKRHDTNLFARALLTDEHGAVLSLAGATVRYTLQHVRLRTLKVNRALASLADQAVSPGEVYYEWLTADVDTSGTYREEWEVTYSTLEVETFPAGSEQFVRILDDLDNV
jgi:hypothetical protein